MNNTALVVSPKAKKVPARKRGQGMTEYIIIVALIAIAAIGIITIFGENIRALFTTSANALAGDVNAKNEAKDGQQVKNKSLKNFGEENKGNF
jgi:pilus assembly protein Flp/PilA